MDTDLIKSMVQMLAQFEKDVPRWDSTRTRILDDLRDGESDAPDRLQKLIDQRRDMIAALRSLELALKNSAASFARFEQKAAKDVQTLADAKKKGGDSSFDNKHPILVAQRQAYERVKQKMDYAATEIDKLRTVLSNKYGKVQGVRELDALVKALREDVNTVDGSRSPFEQMAKRLQDAVRMHRLSK